MKNLNHCYPNSSLNKKLREVYSIKQAVNNSKMPQEIKKTIMTECDKAINQYWRWCYDKKPGYLVNPHRPMGKLIGIMREKYRLETKLNSKNIFGNSSAINMLITRPCLNSIYKWNLKIAPMALFTEWSSDAVICKDFETLEELEDYLNNSMGEIMTSLMTAMNLHIQK